MSRMKSKQKGIAHSLIYLHSEKFSKSFFFCFLVTSLLSKIVMQTSYTLIRKIQRQTDKLHISENPIIHLWRSVRFLQGSFVHKNEQDKRNLVNKCTSFFLDILEVTLILFCEDSFVADAIEKWKKKGKEKWGFKVLTIQWRQIWMRNILILYKN